MRRQQLPYVLFAVAAVLVAGCGDDGATVAGLDATIDSNLRATVTVSAAASLTDAFTEIGERFSAAHPEAHVELNFDASSILATQIIEGAPADVFASADEVNMARLGDEDLLAREPQVFARNELVVVTKPGNPGGIDDLADLAEVGVVSLCGEEAPCGRYAREVLDGAGVTIPESSVTRGQNVTATLTAVTQGDAVAAIVYSSDALRAGDDVAVVPIPTDQNVVATYPIAVLADGGNSEVADAFEAFVLSDDGQAVLEELGFLPAR